MVGVNWLLGLDGLPGSRVWKSAYELVPHPTHVVAGIVPVEELPKLGFHILRPDLQGLTLFPGKGPQHFDGIMSLVPDLVRVGGWKMFRDCKFQPASERTVAQMYVLHEINIPAPLRAFVGSEDMVV